MRPGHDVHHAPLFTLALALCLVSPLACSGGGESGASDGATTDHGASSTAATTAGTGGATSGGATADTTSETATSSSVTGATTSATSETAGETATNATTASATTASATTTVSATTGATTMGVSATTGATTMGVTTGATTGMAGELGELAGECGLIDAMEIDSPDSFLFANSIDFGDIGFDYDLLTPGAQEVFDDGNLNQSSLHSEVIAFEVLARCDMATLLKTEGEVVYSDPMGKKTDLLVELDGFKVGVSVTRAYGFPPDDPYTVAQAEALLTDKLGDIPLSTANVAPEDQWVKQILHVIAYADMHAESVATAYAGLPANVKGDTVVLVTVTHGDDEFVY